MVFGLLGVLLILSPFGPLVAQMAAGPRSASAPPAPVSNWVREHTHGGYALGQYADVGKWAIALTGFRTTQGRKIDPPANGRMWLVTSWKLLIPSMQTLQVDERDWTASSLEVPVFAETEHGNAHGRSVVGQDFPQFKSVTPGHTVTGNIAFEIFQGDRNPFITVKGRDQNGNSDSVTRHIRR